MTTRTKNILKAKLPEALKFEDCMDKDCFAYDYVVEDFDQDESSDDSGGEN